MKKIVITGGLGYIGTELCRIYSGYSWNYEITVIDKNFVSDRVNQLRKWNIEFVQGDILNKEIIKKHCSEADVIHHLAGITQVPRVASESNSSHDELIKNTAEVGTQNILDAMSKKCKIIFPSTHVIFEGTQNVKKDILENEVPNPKLIYSKSKVSNENQIKNSGKNFIILKPGALAKELNTLLGSTSTCSSTARSRGVATSPPLSASSKSMPLSMSKLLNHLVHTYQQIVSW